MFATQPPTGNTGGKASCRMHRALADALIQAPAKTPHDARLRGSSLSG